MKLDLGYNSDEMKFIGKFSVLVLTGASQVFKDEFTNRLKIHFSKSSDLAPSDIKKDLDAIQYKPFFKGKWWYYVNYDKLGKKGWSEIANYLRKPSKYAFMIINVSDYRQRKAILKNKIIKESEEVAWVDFEYPKNKFLREYIESELYGKKISFKTIKLIMERLASNYDEYPTYLRLLKDLPDTEITDSIVKTVVDDLSQYGIDNLLNALVKLDRKTIPFKALNDLVEESSVSEILSKLKYSFKYIYQARVYLNRGLLIDNGNINEDKSKIQPVRDKNKKTLLNLHNKYINRYLTLARFISSKELVYINTLLSSYSYVDIVQLTNIIMTILNRRDVLGDVYKNVNYS